MHFLDKPAKKSLNTLATAEAVYRVRGKQEGTPRKKKVLHVFTSRAAGATPAVVEQDQLHVVFPYLDPLFGSGHMASEGSLVLNVCSSSLGADSSCISLHISWILFPGAWQPFRCIGDLRGVMPYNHCLHRFSVKYLL